MSTEREVRRYNQWLEKLGIIGNLDDIRDKQASVDYYTLDTLNRTSQMFRWDGLPDEIPQRNLEMMLQCNGNVFIPKNKPYAFTGGLGGEPDVYYEPTIYTIANPALKYSANVPIDEGVLIRNDTMMIGLLPTIKRYAQQLAENDITLHIAEINLRAISMIAAPDDRTKKAAEMYLKQIEDGRLGVIMDNTFLEGIRVLPLINGLPANYITQLLELRQYLRAGLKNDLGIDSNFNMKRESLNDGEAAQNEPSLLTLVDDMLKQREVACEKLNEMFGWDVKVEKNGAWELEETAQEAEIEAMTEEPEQEEQEEKEEDGEDDGGSSETE